MSKSTRNSMSILDAMREAVAKSMDEDHAITYCRARIHIPRVSTKMLREAYQTAVSIKEQLT